jgi:REP element-mobilizing transposase RayT
MVLAYHVILSAYGFWLPNDPRGSWSDFVRAWELVRFGKATKTDERCSLAAEAHDAEARLAAKAALKFPPVKFTGLQARAVGRGFGAMVEKSGLTIWACSILPEHVHLVIRRHRFKVEQIVNLLKGAATRRLNEEGIHPLAQFIGSRRRPPHAWARKGWQVFLDSESDIVRAIKYVEDNPMKEGLPPQRWPFVQTFEGL